MGIKAEEALAAAQAYAEKLTTGVASGIESTTVDEENNTIIFNFKDGTSQEMKIETPQAKVDTAVNVYLAKDEEELNTKMDELIEGRS